MLAHKYEARFSSSICDGPEKDELELPIAMVCIVATTVSSVHFSSIASHTDVNRTMLCLITGVKGINGAKVTSALKLMNIFTEVMSSSSTRCVKQNRSSITD